MTDKQVKDLLLELGAQRLASWKRNDPDCQLPDDAPSGIKDSFIEQLWYIGIKPSCDAVLAAGATPQQVEVALADYKTTHELIEPSDLVPIPEGLAQLISVDVQQALLDELGSIPRRLDERVANWITEYRVEMYSDESKHRGRPHVVVVLPDGKISVSLEDPPILLTSASGYRGVASALKVVKKHIVRLRKLWDDTRPDDQRLTAHK